MLNSCLTLLFIYSILDSKIIFYLILLILIINFKMSLTPHNKSPTEDLFSTFQTVVHLSEDLKSKHVFVVLGASVSIKQ